MKILSKYLSGPALLHYVLPILMIYLIAGTIAQKYIGLYEATHMFFSSPILWIGSVPLPGLPLLIALICMNLIFKLFFKSPWRLRNAGIIITHIGAILLLLGGLFTALFSKEGYVDFAVGESKNFVSDYHIREFVVLDEDGKEIEAFGHKAISTGDHLTIGNYLTLDVLETCRNCEITKREITDNRNYFGMAQHMQLSPGPLRQEDEVNMAGMTFAVTGSENDGAYVVLENVPRYPEISLDGKTYQLMLRRQYRALPFQIELLEFHRDMHPGTDMAKSYQSRVLVKDGETQWESLIQMNEPLRYKGYTFFQSSFLKTEAGDISVLAVVHNNGKAFPYISGIVMCIGLIVHLLVRRRKTEKQQRDAYAT